MDAQSGHLNQLREALRTSKQHLALRMAFAWSVYSKPCPSDTYEMLTFVLLCFLVSSTISTLLFVWMVFSLDYDNFVAGLVSGGGALVMLALLILMHPVRCVITVTVPSMCTKQGRKIILSTVLLYVITSCMPNITHNMACSLHMLKCSTGNISQSIVESCKVPKAALNDTMNTLKDLPSFKSTEYSMDLDTSVDVNNIKRDLFQASEKIRTELSQLHSTMKQISQVLKKAIAGLFVLLLISSSVTYVNSYLTLIKHDNVYHSHQLMEALQNASSNATLPKSYQKKLVKTSGVWMSARELKRRLWGLFSLLVYAFVCGIMIGLDHFVFWSLQSLLEWASDIPAIRGNLHVSITITGTYIGVFNNHLGGMERSYPYTISMLPHGCVPLLSVPESSTLTSICVFLALGFLMLLGEVYACRLRRKVCASFYPTREEQRTQYLLWKILEKRESDNAHL